MMHPGQRRVPLDRLCDVAVERVEAGEASDLGRRPTQALVPERREAEDGPGGRGGLPARAASGDGLREPFEPGLDDEGRQ